MCVVANICSDVFYFAKNSVSRLYPRNEFQTIVHTENTYIQHSQNTNFGIKLFFFARVCCAFLCHGTKPSLSSPSNLHFQFEHSQGFAKLRQEKEREEKMFHKQAKPKQNGFYEFNRIKAH